jgi:tetratricopeptide (TPR) repeat protein
MFNMNRLSLEKRAQIIGCLVEGNSMRATSRLCDVSINTVTKLLVDVGAACSEYQDKAFRNLTCKRIQCDEIWAFCYAKKKNVPEVLKGRFGYGDVYTWTAIDAETKLVPSFATGPQSLHRSLTRHPRSSVHRRSTETPRSILPSDARCRSTRSSSVPTIGDPGSRALSRVSIRHEKLVDSFPAPLEGDASTMSGIDIEGNLLTAQQALGVAVAIHESGHLDAAKDIYLKLLAQNPDNADALHLLGVCAIQDKRYDEAIALIGRAIEIQADNAIFFSNLATALHGLGKYDDAAHIYRHAISLKPDYQDAYYNLGNCLFTLGSKEAAVHALKKSIELNPSHAESHLSLGWILEAEEDFSQAELFYRQALQITPDHVEARAAHSRVASAASYRTVTAKLSSIKTWCAVNCARYRVVEPETTWNVPAVSFFNPPPGSDEARSGGTATIPELYLAEIGPASIIGGHTAILVSGTKGDQAILYDMITRYSRERLVANDWAIDLVEKDAAVLKLGTEPHEEIPAGIMLSGNESHNYSHWLLEFLPRLWILDSLGGFEDVPLLVDKLLYPQEVEALDVFNRARRPVIFLEHRKTYHIGRLAVPGATAFMPLIVVPQSVPSFDEATLSPRAVEFLRDVPLREAAGSVADGFEKIYVSRKESRYRRMLNEAEVEQLFEAMGFAIVRPERHSFTEQVRIFSRARLIAGCAGAGMTNMVFAPTEAKVLVLTLFNKANNYRYLSNIGALCGGQQVEHVFGSPAGHGYYAYQGDFVMDLAQVRQAATEFFHLAN